MAKPRKQAAPAATTPDTSSPVTTDHMAEVFTSPAAPAAGDGEHIQPEVETETQAASPAGEPIVTALIVTAQVDGFRRAGRAWSREATRVAADEFDDEQIAALLAEPMLEVLPVAD